MLSDKVIDECISSDYIIRSPGAGVGQRGGSACHRQPIRLFSVVPATMPSFFARDDSCRLLAAGRIRTFDVKRLSRTLIFALGPYASSDWNNTHAQLFHS